MLNWLLDGKKTAAERREEMLSAYIDGELSPRERADLERALARDATLRAELEDLRQVVRVMKAAPRVPLPRSFTLDPAVYGRASQPWLQLYPALRAATVLATVVFVFLFAGDLFLNWSGGAGLPAQVVGEAQVAVMRESEEVLTEAKRVEVTLLAEAAPAEEAADVVPEKAVDMVQEYEAPAAVTEAEVESAAQIVGTESMTEEPAETLPEPTTAARVDGILAEEPEEPAEAPMVMAAPPTMTIEATAEAEISWPEPAMPEETAAAAAAEVAIAPEMAEEELLVTADDEETTGTNWVLIAQIGLAALAATLLVLTLLARRFGW